MATSSVNNLLDKSTPAVEGDSDYDELHLPDTEDEPDTATPKDEAGPPEIPFIRIHELPLGFDDPIKSFLIPHCNIELEIVTVERSPSTHFLNPNLYVIQLRHSEFEWTIKRRYKHFQRLHQELRLFRASLAIPLPTRRHRERRQSFPSKERKNLPRFPKKPDALISQDEVPKRREELQEYLRSILSVKIYRKHHETLRFLEIGPLSFITNLGGKHREGWVKKRSGGQRANAGCLVMLRRALISCFGIWGKRWMVVKDTFIALIRPDDGAIRAVLLFDQGFEVETGLMDMGIYNGIQVSNLTRHLLLKCWTKRKVREWMQELTDVARTTARDFTQQNRYESFAPVRSNTDCRWFIDGASYFEAVADALEIAKEEIFITDWWLSPEIYLKRPVIMGEMWRLDHILKRKAEQGVRVYVLLFKEMELGLSINSFYSKQQLVNMHPNIRVLRHPDHLKDGVLLWSHHEKIVVIDQIYAFLGGVDLCYGRWDNYMHKLTDLGGVMVARKQLEKSASNFELSLEPGEALSENGSTPINVETGPVTTTDDEVENVEKKAKPKVTIVVEDSDKTEDEEEVEEKKKRKKSRGSRWKALVRAHQESEETSPEGASGSSPLKSQEKGFSRYIPRASRTRGVVRAIARFQSLKKHIQTRRRSFDSVDSLNMGATLDSLDAPTRELQRSTSEIGLPQLGLQGSAKLWHGKDYSNFIVKDFVDLHDPYKDLVDRNVIPRMPWHDIGVMVQGTAARDVARHFIQRWNYTKFEKAKSHERYPYLMPKSYTNLDTIPRLPKSSTGTLFCASAQILRSVSDWSAGTKTTEQSIHTAYIAAIFSAQHFIYIENQFFISQAPGHKDVFNEVGDALFRRIMRAHGNGDAFKVYVVMPLLPAFEGEIGTATGTAIHAITHWNYASISRGPDSLMGRLRKEGIDPKNYITFHGLRTYSTLSEKLVTELIYVHSKLMIVDDRIVIIGSANLNDRSLLGRRDSEIAVIITDEDFEPSIMNGKPYEAGKFACTLRRTLFREHLGLMDKNAPNIDIKDPVCDQFYKDVWLKLASVNTDIFEKLFHCIPTDTAQTFVEVKKFLSEPGLAESDPEEAERMAKRIQGHLVLLPLQFLYGEVLTPASGTKESLMPVCLWT